MNTPTLAMILEAIKRALESIDGLRAFATEPEQIPGSSAPIAYPRVVDWIYDVEFDGDDYISTTWHFDIWVLVTLAAGTGRAQTVLDPYLSPMGRNSLKRALERDVSLSECVNSISVTGGGAYGTTDVAGVRCLAASIRAEVMT